MSEEHGAEAYESAMGSDAMTGTDAAADPDAAADADAALDRAWLDPTDLADALPHPSRQRWQPLRIGLVDLFYYDDEQFWFHDGRLLLRGNNGTGKSKVLALTLPFLLDGSVLPRRVEPDADSKKRMEWNLLLGGAHPQPERTGYTWAEFGRIDEDGSEHFLTLGIGLKAAAGRGIVKTWYFTSDRRIGDLRLVDDNRVVLTQERLRDELAATQSGQVHATQEAYRRAVDEALFRLGESRYSALIDLLIQLRQPQLSKKPNEKALSAALTEALAPLDQAVVADVAESFRSLEEERTGIAAARETLGAAQEFLGHYRAYARVAARRHATAVREANSAYEWAGRNLRDAEGELASARAEVVRLEHRRAELSTTQSTLDGEKQALHESAAMQDARRLTDAEQDAEQAAARARAAAEEAEHARRTADRERDELVAAERSHDEQAAAVTRHRENAAALAVPAGLAADHDELFVSKDAARRALTRRREQIQHVRGLVQSAKAAAEQASRRLSALDTAEAEASQRGERMASAEKAAEAAAAAHRDGIRRYLSGLRLLAVPDGLEERAEAWASTLEGEPPVREAVTAAADEARGRGERERIAAEHEQRRLSEQLAQLRVEISDLESGRDPEPPATPGRDATSRVNRPGAPLWRVAEFRDEVSDGQRAGIEAALASAGLLDAWIFPDGTLGTDDDVILGPGGAPASSSLGILLAPAVGPDEQIGADAVAAVLDRIGVGETSQTALWIDADGRWGSGPARGSWHKDRAEFIGAGAREAHRRELLHRLRADEDQLSTDLAFAQKQVTAAVGLLDDVTRERDAYPAASERVVIDAHRATRTAQEEQERAQLRADQARDHWQQATAEAAQAADDLHDQAAQLALGSTDEQLDAASEAITAYSEVLAELHGATQVLVGMQTVREQARRRAADAAESTHRREQESAGLRDEAASLRARFETLRSTVGASVAELQERLSAVESALKQTARQVVTNHDEQVKTAASVGRLEQKVRGCEAEREQTAQTREAEVRRIRAFVGTGLLRVALPDLEAPDSDAPDAWHVTTAVALARGAEQRLDGADESDDAWSRAQQRVSSAATELSGQMSRHGHTSFVEQHDDVMVARVRYLNDEIAVDQLADRLAADVADRERLLSAREREILENHLVSEVAGHLHELLLAAEEQIDRMNRELAARRTSTGMQLRVRWRERTDGPVGLAKTRELMLRSDATWTAADRTAIGDFLQGRMAEVRQSDPTGGWQEHLEQALDYRHWHGFIVERLQNGQWRSASGPASGGEKALAVSVPLFAAASAHYNSASDLAPRLILLDEAFAGVDDDSRAKSLGLLATFDLDVVMTSEREWGCYPQVPGLSIAQLSRIDGVDAVGVTRWRWDGRRRDRLDEVAPAATAAGIPAPARPDDDATLFG